MSQLGYADHVQSEDVLGHPKLDEPTIMRRTSINSLPQLQLMLPKRRPNTFQSSQVRQRQKHKVALFIGSFIILHLSQRLVSFYQLDQPPTIEINRDSPPPFFINLILFVKAENSANNENEYKLQNHFRRNQETRRVDNLLRAPRSTRARGASDEPLEFIKYSTRQRDDFEFDDADHRHRHSHSDHCIHNSHQYHKHRLGSPSGQAESDLTVKEERTHHHRERSKRHNVPAFLEGSGSADRPIVATKKGLVKGITQRIFTGKFVDAFLGIPFAKPPVGKYRFRHPQPNNPWTGELDASRLSNSCYQVNDTFFGATFGGTSIWNANTPLDEDCLHLNIWTPFGVANTTISSAHSGGYHKASQIRGSTGTSSTKRPVLVWIFGGGFYSGTSTLKLYEGGALASEEDIIVVSVNYRVSALGFLYFGRPDAPGNAGLFDQLLALQWIKDNIEQFGGDPEKVTIFGESAGAVSAAYHLISPLSRDLFSQAILQSGAATNPWGSIEARDIIANGLQLASALNCPANQSDLNSVIECLLRADPMALVSQEVGQTSSIINFPFVPVVDGSFLLEPPVESLSKSNFKPARILLGSNNDEGSSYLVYMSEFSHCPSSNGNDDQSKTQHDSTSSIGSTRAPPARDNLDGLNTPDSRGEFTPSNDLENLDLIRPEHQTASVFQGKVLSSSHVETESIHIQQSMNHTLQRSTAATQKQQQFAYFQNESKPCKPNENLSISREGFLQILREEINPYAEHPIGKISIAFEYLNWNNPNDPASIYDGLDKIVGDYYFTCHVNEFAYRYAQTGNAVYMYYFKQRSSMSPWPKWMGVLHGDEISFVFGEPLNPLYNYTQKEIELSRRMMKYWANFAKYGNPTKNGENSSMPEKWPEYADKRQYFELHGDYVRIGRGPRSKQCAFWSKHLPQLIQSYDKNNQCQVPGDITGRLSALRNKSDNHSLLTTIPSFLLFSFFVILLLTALVGSFAIVSKRTSWKFNLWPNLRGGASSSSSPDDDDEGGANRTGSHNNSNA